MPASDDPAPRSWDALVAGCGLPRLEARMLAEAVAGRRREWLIAHGDETVADEAARRFDVLAARRRAGEPIAYLTGEREFHGLSFRVSPAVLVPRPETELLVDWAIEHAPAGSRVLELGTGSGAIAVALAAARPDLTIVATDVSEQALSIARANAAALLGPRATAVEFRQGDWYDALAEQAPFALIVANPPYLASDDPHLAAPDLRHEPRGALTDFNDGLSAIRAIIEGARTWLDAGGRLAFEHGWDQGPATRALLAAAGFADVRTLRDDEGRERVGCGRRPA